MLLAKHTVFMSKNIFFLAIILATSGLVSPPIALLGGLIFGFGAAHPFHVESKRPKEISAASFRRCLRLWLEVACDHISTDGVQGPSRLASVAAKQGGRFPHTPQD